MVARDVVDKAMVQKLFATIAPRYVDRAGGYTRMLRLGHRRGDSADVAEVEFLGSEYNPNAEAELAKAAADKPKKKTVGGRIREALGGGWKKSDDAGAKTKAPRPARGAGKKVTTPRKAGGA